MKKSKKFNHSLASFNSYLEFMNCSVFQTFVSIQINHVTKKSYTSFAAIIFSGIPERFVIAYKFKHMSEPYIECTMHSLSDCINIVNELLKH